MRSLSLTLPPDPETSYPIIVGENLDGEIESFLTENFPKRRIAALVDSNVYKHHSAKIDQLVLEKGKVYSCPAGESNKHFKTVEDIALKMLEDGFGRDTLILNIGGGMVCDLGGFLASIFMRGVPFVHIPTTLLGMVDASIGGKTGIDLNNYKNALGIFAQPSAIFSDIEFVKNLPEREYTAGIGECIKHGLINDLSILTMIEQNNYSNSVDFIFQNIQLKSRIVEKDPTEKGIRAMLNLGHTIGHALETYFLGTPDELLHGEAVTLGMIAELHILEVKTGLDHAVTEKVLSLAQQVGLPSKLKNNIDMEKVWSIGQKDKKNKTGQVKISLLKNMGSIPSSQAEWTISIEKEEFMGGLEAII